MSPSNPDSLYILISISLFDPTVHGFLTIMGVTFLASCIQWRTPKQVTKSNWVHIRIILDKCWWDEMCWPLSTTSTMRPIYLFNKSVRCILWHYHVVLTAGTMAEQWLPTVSPLHHNLLKESFSAVFWTSILRALSPMPPSTSLPAGSKGSTTKSRPCGARVMAIQTMITSSSSSSMSAESLTSGILHPTMFMIDPKFSWNYVRTCYARSYISRSA